MVKLNNVEKDVTNALNAKADSTHNEENAKKVKEQSTGSDTVTVACGIPMGLKLETSQGVVILKGVPMSHIVSAIKGVGYLPAGKYGLTTLKASVWEEIAEKYKDYDFMKNQVIFAKDTYAEAVDQSKDLSGEKLDANKGFDQADPKKSPRTRVKKEEE